MPIVITDYPELDFKQIEISGRVTIQDVKSIDDATFHSKDGVIPAYEFTDLSRITGIGFDFSQMTGVVDRMTNIIGRQQKTHRFAVFAPTELSFGVARMYEQSVQKDGVLVFVSKDRQEALAWLGMPELPEALR